MTRSRFVVMSSFAIVAVGLAAALGALAVDPARAAMGPLPPEGLALLADARFVMGLEVKRFTESTFYRRYGVPDSASRPNPFRELEEKTGLDPGRDVDRIFVVGGSDAEERGAVLVLGRFDLYTLGRAIENEKPGVAWKYLQGATVYLFNEGARKPASALAFLDDQALVLGTQRTVESVVARSRGTETPRGNAAILELLGRIKAPSTFWMVGDRSLLARIPRTVSLPPSTGSPSASAATLPALESLVVTGDLDPAVTLSITAETSDETAARNLADVVRGFVALASLEAGEKPAFRELASAVGVTTEGNRVHATARFTYELLEALVE